MKRAFILLILLSLAGTSFGETAIDKNGNLLVGGKPFFPIGIYIDGDTVSNLGSVKETGINSVVFAKRPTKDAVVQVEKAGLVALEVPKGLPFVKMNDISKFEFRKAEEKPAPKLYLLSVSDDLLQYAATRAVIDGAKGILFPVDRIGDPLKKVNADLAIMSKVALAPFPVEYPTYEDRMQVLYKIVDRSHYILTTNITDKPQSLFIYMPETVVQPTMDIGRDELVFVKQTYFWVGFEKYATLMFHWPKRGF